MTKITSTCTIAEHFAEIDDPRYQHSPPHALLDIITIAICGIICGADDWVAIEGFGFAKEAWFKIFLRLPYGIPSHDTFRSVFSKLDPELFRMSFIRWVEAISALTFGEVVPIDGKTVRRSHDKGQDKQAIHMVSAWASENGLVLGQVKVDDKSNEITAIPELLRLLAINGCIVTIDAMGCQTDIAVQIISQGADYVLALKDNHKRLHQEVQRLFTDALSNSNTPIPYKFDQTVHKDHGRIETRRCWTIDRKQIVAHNIKKSRIVDGFVHRRTVFVEFAPGDCTFAYHMCSHAGRVYAIDICDQRRGSGDAPPNFSLELYNGYDLSLERGIADIVFSDLCLGGIINRMKVLFIGFTNVDTPVHCRILVIVFHF